MDLQKTKIYLDKLNREFARMSKDPENIVRLDTDIMASYVRDLYDAILSDSRHEMPQPEASTPKKAAPPRQQEVVEQPPPPKIVAPAYVAPTPPPAPVEELPVYAAPPPPPMVVEEKPAPSTFTVSSESGTYDALFEEKQAKELSEKLSEMPIADLKKAIALNDRLLLTRELFAGDGQSFETTIQMLNGVATFANAQSYLIDHCVVRYAWMDPKRIDEAKKFIKLVRRRYK